RDPAPGDYPARHAVEAALHCGDVAEGLLVSKRRVAGPVVRHEAERPGILDPTELGAEVPDQPASLAVGNPLAEVVQAGGVAEAHPAAVAHPLDLAPEALPRWCPGSQGGPGHGEAGFDEGDAVEPGEGEGERFNGGCSAGGTEVRLEG